MGRVLTKVKIENLKDVWAAESGARIVSDVRSIESSDAFVDSGATLLSLPTKIILQLGLDKVGAKRVTSRHVRNTLFE